MKLDFDPKKNMSIFAYCLARLKSYYTAAKTVINNFLSMSKIAKNWFEITIFRIGLKKKVLIKFRDGKTFYAKNKKDYFDLWHSEFGRLELLNLLKRLKRIEKVNKIIKIEMFYRDKNVWCFFDSFNNGMIDLRFLEKEYNKLDVDHKYVVDIGANIGDSTIYFALNGAKHVYAFEPYPYSYNIAEKNVNLNRHLSKKITLLNEGCGKSGFIKIKKDFQNSVGSDIKSFEKGERIKISDLDEIVKRFKLKHATLKLDCEGCEYALLLNASHSSLNAFDQIILEYHYGYKNLEDRLKKAGFRVKRKQPAYLYNKDAENKDMYIGLIYAKK